MAFKFKTQIINSFLGDCLFVTDITTNKNVEFMRVQGNSILRKYDNNCCGGSFPHGGFDVCGENIIIYHDSDRENHEIEITINDLISILKDNQGVERTGKEITFEDLF